MINDQSITRLLNHPKAPSDLEQRIQRNLQGAGGPQYPTRRWWLSGIAAAVLLALVIVMVIPATPVVVVAASQDIQARARHDKGVTIPVSTISEGLHIKDPLQEMTVQMTKKCRLGDQEAIHLQIAGANQGEVHLFIRQTGIDEAWPVGSGELNDMYWQVLSPRADLEVLVLRSADMNPDNVARLIRHMFYS